MRIFNRFMGWGRLACPALMAAAAAVVVLDLVAFWGFERRPVISYAGLWLGLWAALIATAWVWGARWLIAGEHRMRGRLAAAAVVMAITWLAHPYGQHRVADAAEQQPGAVLHQALPTDAGVVEFSGPPLSRADKPRGV